MSLLNPRFPALQAYGNPSVIFYDVTEPTSGLALLCSEFEKNNDIWYCYITGPDSFKFWPMKQLIGEETIQKVKNLSAYIVIDLSFEPFLDAIDAIYQDIILALNVPSSQVIFMSAMYDTVEYNNKAALKYNVPPMKLFYFSALEYMIHESTRFSHHDVKPLQIKNYNKTFLNFNRRWRSHRPMMTLLLYYRKLLERGYISFGPCEQRKSYEDIWDSLKVQAITNEEIKNAIALSEDIKTMPFLYLDTTDLNVNRPNIDNNTDKYYEDSYFSLVSETTFYTNNATQYARFITEKTYKAILMKHPFVLITIPKSLELLKRLGYKTFSPWIDESYDEELDDNKRMILILNEVERLSNLSPVELEKFIENVVPICEHNHNILKTQQNFIHLRH